jgi:hypothetical protein
VRRGEWWLDSFAAWVLWGRRDLLVVLARRSAGWLAAAVIYKGKFGSIPLKDHHFGSISLLSHLHVGPHESMTCGVHGIYLKFGSFNGIDPIVPFINVKVVLTVGMKPYPSLQRHCLVPLVLEGVWFLGTNV